MAHFFGVLITPAASKRLLLRIKNDKSSAAGQGFIRLHQTRWLDKLLLGSAWAWEIFTSLQSAF